MHAALADDPFPADAHDHTRCVDSAVARASDLCAVRGARLTELRRRVLELVWASHAPVGAYDILERLAAERGRVAPPTVYRALEFLAREGLVHRLDSLNAFVGCAMPGAAHRAMFLICRRCRNAAEIQDPDAVAGLERAAGRAGFRADSVTVELAGTCSGCREAA